VTQHKPLSNVLANLSLAVGCALVLTAPAAAQGSRNVAAAPGQTKANAANPGDTNPHATALAGFEKRLEDYVAMKKKLDNGLPSAATSDNTAAVEARQKMLADRIKGARQRAQPGDLFGDAGPILKQIIEKDAQNRGVHDAYAAMQEVPSQNPPQLNAAYPEKAALATVPPLILVNLPRLPDNLEYRFMGRDMILRDRDANLILDFIVGAVPAIKPQTPTRQPATTAPPAKPTGTAGATAPAPSSPR
jgi:hypothetical protein